MIPTLMTVQEVFEDFFRYYAGTEREICEDQLEVLLHVVTAKPYATATELILIRNETFDSNAYGKQSLLLAGPYCTVKTAMDLDRNRAVTGDMPSQWQLPICYCLLTDEARQWLDDEIRERQ